jgi:hypothetical protein
MVYLDVAGPSRSLAVPRVHAAWSEAPAPCDVRETAFLTDRDRAILAFARDSLRGERTSFAETLEALQEAVMRLIPAGRTYFLGRYGGSPIVGSLVSGVGLAQGPGGVVVVRVRPCATVGVLGRLLP